MNEKLAQRLIDNYISDNGKVPDENQILIKMYGKDGWEYYSYAGLKRFLSVKVNYDPKTTDIA